MSDLTRKSDGLVLKLFFLMKDFMQGLFPEDEGFRIADSSIR
jgi:hypothetical protein